MHRVSVIAIRLPEVFTARQARRLCGELNHSLAEFSASVALDLSQVKKMDLDGMEALLNCMELLAKRDIALQVEELSPEALAFLELTRMDRLLAKFAVFPVEAPAVTELHEPVTQEAGTVVQLPVAA